MSISRYQPSVPAHGTRLDVATLRDLIAPEAADTELAMFAMVCRQLDLDPFAGHIYLIGRNQKTPTGWRKIHKPQISVAGRRAIAERTGRLEGIEGPWWCGARRYDSDGEKLPLEWEDLWDEEEPPYAARCLVWRAGWKTPANGTAKWSEFAVYDDADRKRLGRFWRDEPSHMLGKVAEALALRRAFPEVQAAIAAAEGDDDGLEAEAGPAADTGTGEITGPSVTPSAGIGPAQSRLGPAPTPTRPRVYSHTDTQRREMADGFDRLGYHDREGRLRVVSQLLRRPVTSVTQLSDGEADAVLAWIEDQLRWPDNETGGQDDEDDEGAGVRAEPLPGSDPDPEPEPIPPDTDQAGTAPEPVDYDADDPERPYE